MTTVEKKSTFIKQEHTSASKTIAGLAFTTVFSEVCCKEMYVFVRMKYERGK